MKEDLLKRVSGALGLAFCIVAAVGIGVIIILMTSSDPARSLRSMFWGPFSSKYFFGNMLEGATPLIFTGLGISLAFRSSATNLGAEGQVHTGALAGTALLFAIPDASPWVLIPAAILVAALAAGAQAGISGGLKAYFGANELITSYMLGVASIHFMDFILGRYLLDPRSSVLQTPPFPLNASLPRLMMPSKLNIAFIIALVVAVIVYVLMFRTQLGFQLRMAGMNREFSRYIGIDTNRVVILAMLLSGALAGMGGILNVMGVQGRLMSGFSASFGWTGITVALIARNHPLGVIPAALFYSYLDTGANVAALMSDISPQIAGLVQSVIFFLVTAQAVFDYIHRLVARQKAKPGGLASAAAGQAVRG